MLDANTNFLPCAPNLSAEDCTNKMQFNITEKKTCEYQKYMYAEKMCDSIYYDYTPAKTDYPEIPIDIDLTNVNTQALNNYLDAEMATNVDMSKFLFVIWCLIFSIAIFFVFCLLRFT